MHLRGRYKFITADGKETPWHENLIMLGDGTGMNLFIRQLGNNQDYGMAVTHLKLGLGNTAPTEADTDLENANTDPIVVTQRTFIGDDEVEFKFFATDLQVPDETYNEVGLYVGNQLFARSIINPAFVKASGVDTTIIYSIAIVSES